MVRKLIKSLLSLSLIAPMSAFSLGLGDVHLHSALSERLDADIELLSVSAAEADSLSVSLASQETFAKVGLERPAILMFLSFEKVQDAAGNYTIKVTSKEPINEPFLDFMVEVNWRSGRVLREYTLLLDPPSGYVEAAPAVTAPAAASATTTASTSTTPTVPASAAPAAAMTPAAPTSTMTAAPASSVTPVAGMSAPAAATGSLVYGPVKANDTLWRIADNLRPSKDISVQQMMVALLKANPYAFFDGNINRLKRGYVLRIDDPSMLSAMNRADAAREVAQQTRAWHDYRERVAGRAKQRAAAASAVEATPGMATATKSEPKLTLVAPEGEATDSAASSGAGGEVSEKLMLALESSAAQRKENDALKQRLEALEGQLQDMEKIVSLKDADLAALQQQLRKQGQAVDLPSEKPAPEVAIKPAEEPGLVVKPEEKPAEPAMPAEAAKPEATPAETAVPAEVTPVPAEAKPEAAQPVVTKPEATKPVVKKPKPRPVPMPVEEPSLIDSLMADQMMLGIGGGSLIFILILLVLIIKRRRKGGFQESILNAGAGSSSMMKASDEQGSETSFLSDLAISGMGPGTIQTDEGEVDPLTEADVFMAYGRNQQAEDVLKKAREKSPERADIAVKLLEVYYNSKDKEQFEALAEEAVGSLQGDDDLWGKVLGMGHELCPDNVLFKEGAGAELPTAAVDTSADTVMDIGLDLDELSAEMEGEGSGGDMDLDLGLDFSDLESDGDIELDLELDSGEPEADTALDMGDFGLDEPQAQPEESTDLDMDLGALDLDSGSEESADDAGSLDFDLDLGDADEATADSSDEIEFDLGDLATEEAAAEEDMSFDLDMGELTTEGDEAGMDMSLDMDMDIGDFGLGDLDSSSETDTDATSETSLDLDMALDDLGSLDDFGDLGDMDTGEDEMTTKLDLAQAYAEMGDAEGARSMLEEVVSGGSDEQKQQAQALIDKL